MAYPNKQTVGIIILNWNNWEDTENCLESLKNLYFTNTCKVYVVDNNSSDHSPEKIKSWIEANEKQDVFCGHNVHFKLIVNTGNFGYAGGNNIGINAALNDGSSFVWVVNNDILFTKNSLASLISKCDHGYDVVGAQIRYLSKPDRIWCEGGGYYHPMTMKSHNISHNYDITTIRPSAQHEQAIEKKLVYIAGASLFFTRSALERVGLLTEDYFLYFEEPDWFQRAKKFQVKIGYASECVLYHGVGKSTDLLSQESRLGLKLRYLKCRNSILFGWRFHRRYLLQIIFFSMLRELKMPFHRILTWARAWTISLIPPKYQMITRFSNFIMSKKLDAEIELIRGLYKTLPGSAVDVGANYGFVTFALRKTFDKIYAFEPLPDLTKFLEQANLKNVSILNVGLSSEECEADLYVPIHSGTPDYAYATLGNNSIDGDVSVNKVKIVTLDQFNLQDIAFIKIDVEGHELAVLKGGMQTIRKYEPTLMIEIEERHYPGGVVSVSNYLAGLNYRGYFLNREKELVPISEFDVNLHQDERNLNDAPEKYIANFIFITDKYKKLFDGLRK